MATLLFDTESNGFLNEATKLHCLVIQTEEGKTLRYNDQPCVAGVGTLADGLRLLLSADEIVAHNAIKHDAPLIRKLYPWWDFKGRVTDTLVLSQLIWSNLKEADFAYQKAHPQFPNAVIGSHSLKAWGYRLGEHKGEYSSGWEQWSQGMEDYCVQDVAVLAALWAKVKEKNYAPGAIQLEHDVAKIIFRQIQHGVLVDYKALTMLVAKLQALRAGLESRLRGAFDPWYVRDGNAVFVPKRDNTKAGYVAGAGICKVKQVVFNPGSRTHIASRLMAVYGWKPTEMNADGPKVDEDVLSGLDYPQVPDIISYLTTGKILGMAAEGKHSWMKYVGKDGHIHGGVTPNGAVTGRATHHHPNMAQVPKVGSLYGAECRAVFVAPEGKVMVGADLSGLELRCLAHFMARYDGGAYAKAVIEGKQEDGTDVHSLTARALGLDSKRVYTIGASTVKGRDIAKTFLYAWLYGAGATKIGSIVGKGAKEGSRLRNAFLSKMPALKSLIDDVKKAAKRGYLLGLDGRLLHVRSEHAALNTLLQAAGALIAKQALVLLDKSLISEDIDAQQVLWIHDEVQLFCDPRAADTVGRLAVEAFEASGRHFRLRVAITGEYKIGRNWAETH